MMKKENTNMDRYNESSSDCNSDTSGRSCHCGCDFPHRNINCHCECHEDSERSPEHREYMEDLACLRDEKAVREMSDDANKNALESHKKSEILAFKALEAFKDANLLACTIREAVEKDSSCENQEIVENILTLAKNFLDLAEEDVRQGQILETTILGERSDIAFQTFSRAEEAYNPLIVDKPIRTEIQNFLEACKFIKKITSEVLKSFKTARRDEDIARKYLHRAEKAEIDAYDAKVNKFNKQAEYVKKMIQSLKDDEAELERIKIRRNILLSKHGISS